jgi:hypothetical protein
MAASPQAVYDRRVGYIADVLMITGLVMAVCSPVFMVCLVWSAWRQHRKITSTIPLLTCEQVNRAEHLPRRVAVAGRTTSGGRDLLRAPRSGTECAWYQMEYAHNYDGSEQLNRSVDLHPGAELVAVTDGTGTVYLTPQLARTKLTGPEIATMTASGRDGDVGWQEVIVRPDVPVFAVGRPSRSGQLGPLDTIIREKGPWRLPALGFPMAAGRRPSPSQDGIALDSVWLSPCGVSALPAAEVRRRYAVRLTRTIAWLFILPALGLALIALATFV